MKLHQRSASFISLLLAFLYQFKTTHGYSITVDAHAEECFFENIQDVGTKMSLSFEIAEGGFLDIDLKINGPDGTYITGDERKSSGVYTFAATTPGRYTYCFSNKMSTVTPKVVMFNLEVVPPYASNAQDEEGVDHNKLEVMIRELDTTLQTVKREQEYMQVRDRIHRAINESTNSRVVMWSIFEATVLLVMTLGQVYYLKRFFEVQRVV